MRNDLKEMFVFKQTMIKVTIKVILLIKIIIIKGMNIVRVRGGWPLFEVLRRKQLH